MRIGALEGGGTKMVLAVCNENGEVLDRVSIPTETPEITMPKMIAYFKEQQVEALGIGFFGPVILNEQSPKYGWSAIHQSLHGSGIRYLMSLRRHCRFLLDLIQM